jgi:hypothetical protein
MPALNKTSRLSAVLMLTSTILFPIASEMRGRDFVHAERFWSSHLESRAFVPFAGDLRAGNLGDVLLKDDHHDLAIHFSEASFHGIDQRS